MQEHDQQPKKTVTATFRVSERVYQSLQAEAKKQDTSLNTLVNQMLDVHVDDSVYLAKIGYMRIAKSTFKRLVESSADQTLREIGFSAGVENVRTITLARSGALTQETILETLFMFAEFSGYARYSESESNGKRVLVLNHDLGTKGSLFIGSLVSAAFSLIERFPKVTLGDRSVVIEFQ
ncbi:MAG: hypothetical protein ABSF83_15010 [Nitrososphaerales archaeon]|jgi:hypothetical protein